MDLALVMAQLRPGENVSPDMSSYDIMVAHWRGSGSPPSLSEVNDKWIQIEPELLKTQLEESVDKELVNAGADLKAQVDALWVKLMDNNPKPADDLKVVIDQIK